LSGVAAEMAARTKLPRAGGQPLVMRHRARGIFLVELALTGNVRHAARAAGVARSTVYLERKRYRRFAADWDSVLEIAKENRIRADILNAD